MNNPPDELGMPTTRLCLLEAATSEDEARRQEAVNRLVEIYRPGMCRYVTWRLGRDAEPEDVVQSLIADKILGGQLIERYLASDRKGFRVYLKKALCNLARDVWRHENRFRNEKDVDEPLSEAAFDHIVAAEQLRDVLDAVLCRVREYYAGRGRQRDWDAFFRLFIEPIIVGSDAPSYEALVEQLGFASKTEAYNVIVNVKRRFHRTWSMVLEEKLGTSDAAAIDDELGEIRRCLSMTKELSLQELVSKLPRRRVTDEWELQSVSHEDLSRLFDYATNRTAQFTETELRALYRSYASGSLVATFEQCHQQPPKQLVEGESDPSIESVDRLLCHPAPPLDLLNDLRRLSRGILKSQYSTVPEQIGLALRFVSVGLALVRHDEKISKTSDGELRRGFERMLKYAWLDDATRSLFAQAIIRLER